MTDATTPDLYPATPVDAALMYALLDWRVAPVRPGSKVPAISDWVNAATTDADTVHEWLDGAPAGTGVCIVTGSHFVEWEGVQEQRGLWVLDVDVANGKPGLDNLKALVDEHGGLPETIVARTPSGGYHYYFSYPTDAEVHNSASNRLGAGLDVRGEGGQVNAPPTSRGAVGYRWAYGRGPYEVEVQPAPAWLLDLVKDAPKPAPVVEPELPTMTTEAALAVRAAVDYLDGVPDYVTDYNARTNWHERLTADGWDLCYERDGVSYWTRPGKTCREGFSASTGWGGSDVLYVWTTSIRWLPAERAYDRYGYHVHRVFDGDFEAAGRHFAAERRQTPAPPTPKGELLIGSETASDEPQGDPDKRHGRLTWAAEIEALPTVWTWKNRVPAGELTLLAGREGLGKTTIAYTLAAYLTTGTLYGAHHGEPKAALIVATEDSWSKTIRPRLEAAGADLNRVARLDVVERGVESEIDLPVDVDLLDDALTQGDFALLILDPLMSRLSAKLDTHRDGDVRKALEPLVAWSHRSGVAVLGLIHVNKGASGDPLTAVMGSRAFTAVARAVLTVMRAPDGEQRLLGLGKSNLGPTDPEIVPTFSYRIETTTTDDAITTGRLVWGDEHAREIADIWEEAAEGKPESRSKYDEAVEWLTEYLKLNPEGKDRQLTLKEAVAAGHSEATMRKAAAGLGVEVFRMPQVGKPAAKGWRLAAAQSVAIPQDTTEEQNSRLDGFDLPDP